MWREIATLLVLLAAALTPAAAADGGEEHASYDVFAAGLHVAVVDAGFDLAPASYRMQLAYHTTGLVGFFYRGHQINTVQGTWGAEAPEPEEFFGDGYWRGVHRITRIVYRHGKPEVRELVPPNETEREPVPAELKTNTIDTLSALAELIRRVAATARCDTTVHTYDGRRVTEVTARTVRMEIIPSSDRSAYNGPALRCDFEGRMLAGFLLSSNLATDERPLHGTAWLAQVIPAMPPVPVRMTFQTRWFGEATMFLAHAAPGPLSIRYEN
jgi:hypothetical protein